MPRNIESFTHKNFPEKLTSLSNILPPLGVDIFYSDSPEAQLRRDLLNQVNTIFEKIPDAQLDLDLALQKNLISPSEVTSLYHQLSDFISASPDHSRLILYLPLQIIPDLSNHFSASDQLVKSQHKFAQVYQNAWIQQLFESDIRANFVDGDILEPGLGEPPQVRKAAHLIPELLKKNIIQKNLIEEILSINNQDTELTNSIMDGLTAHNPKAVSENIYNFTLANLKNNLDQIDQKYSLADSTISYERANWQKKIDRENIFNKTAFLVNNLDTIESLFNSGDSVSKMVGLKALFNQNIQTKKFDLLIKNQWQAGDNQLKNTIITGLNHWQKKGLVSSDYLSQFGLKSTDLSLPLPVDLDQLLSSDFKNLNEAVQKIKDNPFLSENIYPVFLAFGSRVKGYAHLDSDQDIACFFKPTASFENRSKTLELIKSLPELKNIDKLAEVWTSQTDAQITFRVMTKKEWTMVEPRQIHLLFGGVWLGDLSVSQPLRQDLLSKYLDLSRFGSQKDLVRSYFLRQLETDFLQCRLMHKGYRSFYPDQKAACFSSLNSIDGQSDFWDAGFRRVATQLFLSRVFLPDLSK